MPTKKRLQVFVSSTYSDLKEERQAAVMAILTAGHIPAGMELFAAGDQSQLEVIKRWIDESDVYLLILGGRYGSIEPISGKSYTQIEFEYAIEKGKRLFSVVIDEKYLEQKVRLHGSNMMEKENPQKLKEFRKEVLTRLVKFFEDPKDIKLAIHETMAEFARREDLKGWIPGSESVNTGEISEQIARLTKENSELRKQLADQSTSKLLYSGLTFDELCKLLQNHVTEAGTLLDFTHNNIEFLSTEKVVVPDYQFYNELHYLAVYNIISMTRVPGSSRMTVKLTEDGHKFCLKLLADRSMPA